jgi:hypothetical protein
MNERSSGHNCQLPFFGSTSNRLPYSRQHRSPRGERSAKVASSRSLGACTYVLDGLCSGNQCPSRKGEGNAKAGPDRHSWTAIVPRIGSFLDRPDSLDYHDSVSCTGVGIRIVQAVLTSPKLCEASTRSQIDSPGRGVLSA